MDFKQPNVNNPYAYYRNPPYLQPSPTALIPPTASRPKSILEIPFRVAADVDRTATVQMVTLVQRWSATWHTFFYTLQVYVGEGKQAKTYWIQMTPCSRWPAGARGRPGVCDVLWHLPVPDTLLARRQLYNPKNTITRPVKMGMLLDVIQAAKLHDFVFSTADGPEEEIQLEWCDDVLRAWAKRGLVDASEARINRWRHIQPVKKTK